MKLFKESHLSRWKTLSLFAFLFVLIIGFQNCGQQKYEQGIKPSTNASPAPSKSPTPKPASTSPLVSILTSLASDPENAPMDYFDTDTAIAIKLQTFGGQIRLEDYNQFTWTIEKLGMVTQGQTTPEESTIVNESSTDKVTTTSSYSWTFSERGVYKISVDLKGSDDSVSTVHKTLVVGECDLTPPLEIELERNTLKSGSQSVFNVFRDDGQNSDTINSFLWAVTQDDEVALDSNLLAVGDDSSLSVDWTDIKGPVFVKSFVEFEDEECISHRQQEYIVVGSDQLIQPVIQLRVVDSENPENVYLAPRKGDEFDRYGYQKIRHSNTNPKVVIGYHADTCQYAKIYQKHNNQYQLAKPLQYQNCNQLDRDSEVHEFLNADFLQAENLQACEHRHFLNFKVSNIQIDPEEDNKDDKKNDKNVDAFTNTDANDLTNTLNEDTHKFFKYCPSSSNECYFGKANESFNASDYTCLHVKGLKDDTQEVASKTWEWDCPKKDCTYRFVLNQSLPDHITSPYSISEYNPFVNNEAFANVVTATKTATSSSPQKYYLHVQAKSGAEESKIVAVSVTLKTASPASPVATAPASSSPASTPTASPAPSSP